jgi:hypothetical protein
MAAAKIPPAALTFSLDEVPGLAPDVVRRLRAAGLTTVADVVGARGGSTHVGRLGHKSIAALDDALRRFFSRTASLKPNTRGNRDRLLVALLTSKPLMEWVRDVTVAWPPSYRLVARRRMFADRQRATLAALGRDLGVSREYVRTIEANGWTRLGSMKGIVRVADARLNRLRRKRTAPVQLAELERLDLWFSGTARSPGLLRGLLENFAARHRVTDGLDGPALVVPAALADRTAWAAWLAARMPANVNRRDLRRVAALPLARAGARDLLDPLVALAKSKISRRPTVRSWAEKALREARGPVSIDGLLDRAAADRRPMTRQQARTAIEGLGNVVWTGRNTYALRSNLAAWDRYRSPARRSAARIMRGSDRRQWSTSDLLLALWGIGETWARRAAPHVLEHLLRDAPGIKWLRRGIFALKQDAPSVESRMSIQDLIIDTLTRAGGPLASPEIRRRVAERRSIGSGGLGSPRPPVVAIRRGLWALAGRDVDVATRPPVRPKPVAGRRRVSAAVSRATLSQEPLS